MKQTSENILVYAKIGACIAIILVGIFASLLLHHTSSFVVAQQQSEVNGKAVLTTYAKQVMDDEHSLVTEIIRPCKGPYGPDACGVFGQIKKVAIASGDMVVTSQIQVKQTGQLVTAASNAITKVSDKAGDAVVAVKIVADQATTDLKTTNTLIEGAQPLVGHLNEVAMGATKVEGSLNDFLTDKTMFQLRQNLTDTTGTFSHMLVTADAVETKSTHNYLHPSTNPVKRSWQVVSPFLLPAAQGTAAALTLVAK